MKITKLSKRLGRVISLGRDTFSNVSFVQEAEITLDAKDTVEECEKKLYKLVASMLANDIKRMKEGRKSEPEA